MNLIKNYITNNRCYTGPTKIQVKKLVLHSLGVSQPNAQVLIDRWNNQEAGVSIHAFIEDDRVIQTLPWDYKAWHVGAGKNGSYNTCSIGVEICEPAGHKYNGGTMVGYDVAKNAAYFNKVYQNAVELFAMLCQEFKLDPQKDILCHSEVYKIGYGTNHSDVMQWFPKHGKSMDTFRNDVTIRLSYVPGKNITPVSNNDDINWAKKKLNGLLPVIPGITPLQLNGIYDPELRIAVLTYWHKLGWGKSLKDDGTIIGKATREAMAVGKIK